jgi:hypothetical protein
MIVKLPHIEAFNPMMLPDDFDEQIRKSFEFYTKDTNERYTWMDKLQYIQTLPKWFDDRADRYLSNYDRAEKEVKEIISNRTCWKIEDENDVPDRDEFFSYDFMVECYERGNEDAEKAVRMVQQRGNGSHESDEAMRVMLRIIRDIVDWRVKE